MTLLERVAFMYEKATQDNLTSQKWSLNEASYTARDAIKSLEVEPSGALAVLLLRKAWGSYKNDSRLRVDTLIKSPQRLQDILDFEKEITTGESAKLLDNTIEVVQKIANKFEISDIQTVLDNEHVFIDIFSEAYKNIYDTYTVDRFSCADTKDNEPFIPVYEYKFHCLQDFVNCLKRSDNCIVYARIDGIYDWEDSDKYDVFYAFGCRCGNKVYINSDRDYHATPTSRAIKKTRNPSKKLRNKAGDTWMPYYDLKENGTVSTDTALVTINPDVVPTTKIRDTYDKQAQLIICISMAAMYQKYFIEKVTSELRYNHTAHAKVIVEDSWFGNEIKLLPSVTTALALPGELHLPAVTNEQLSIVHPTLYNNDVTFYDWYIKTYIKDGELSQPVVIEDFLGTKLEAEQRAWWTYRQLAKGLINERRTKEIASCFYNPKEYEKTRQLVSLEIDINTEFYKDSIYYRDETPPEPSWERLNKNRTEWLLPRVSYPSLTLLKDFNVVERINNNLENILRDVLTSGRRQGSWVYSSSGFDYYYKDRITGEKFSLCNVLEDDDYRADTIDRILCTESDSLDYYKSHKRNGRYWYPNNVYNEEFNCDIDWGYNSDTIVVTPRDGGENKTYTFKFICNTFWDLCYLLNCKRKELPVAIRRWLTNSRGNKPYTGNSILDVTDPLASVFDWTDECCSFELQFNMSKTDINKLLKKLSVELSIRDRSKDKEDN